MKEAQLPEQPLQIGQDLSIRGSTTGPEPLRGTLYRVPLIVREPSKYRGWTAEITWDAGPEAEEEPYLEGSLADLIQNYSGVPGREIVFHGTISEVDPESEVLSVDGSSWDRV